MFVNVACAMLLCAPAAPVPKDAPPATVGVAPRIVELKPNNEGKILVQVRRTEIVKTNIGGGAGGNPKVIERTVNKIANVELSEVKDLKIMTAGGKTLELKETVEKLKNGGIVVMTNDGKPVDVAFLRVLKDDTIVFTSPELINTTSSSSGTIIRPLPVPLPGNVAPGIQVQVLPGIVEQEVPQTPAPEKK